eukprot:1678096-Prymnesium_polylepis.1
MGGSAAPAIPSGARPVRRVLAFVWALSASQRVFAAAAARAGPRQLSFQEVSSMFAVGEVCRESETGDVRE